MSKSMHHKAVCVATSALMIAFFLVAGNALAGMITITNSSFEDPVVGAGGFQSGAPTGWVWNGIGAPGTIDEQKTGPETTDTPYGAQWAHLDNTGCNIGVKIGTGLEYLNNKIDLTYIATRRGAELDLNHNVLIIAGDNTSFDQTGSVVLDSVNYTGSLSSTLTYNNIAVSLNAVGDVGDQNQLWLVFDNEVGPAGRQFEIDNVEATSSPIPEPNTLALLVAGVIGLLAYAWRPASS